MLYSYEDKIINGKKEPVKVIDTEALIDWVNNTERILNRMATDIATLQRQVEHLSERISYCSGHSRF